MPTQSTRRASAASRNDTIAPVRKKSLGPIRKNTGPDWPKCFNADRRRPYPPGPIVAPEVIAKLQREHRAIQLNLLLLKRDLAWQDVIDKAIRMCRLLRQAELAELDAKYRPDQPRVPAGNPDGGQWVDAGGGDGTAAAGVAATAPGGRNHHPRRGGAASGTGCRQAPAAAASRRADCDRCRAPAPARWPVGILMATATSTGGTQQEQVETLADGTVVTVSSYGDTPDKTIRAESPDGTVTYATIAIDRTRQRQSPGWRSPFARRRTPADRPQCLRRRSRRPDQRRHRGRRRQDEANLARQERHRRDASAGGF